jgi:hypothetical protein
MAIGERLIVFSISDDEELDIYVQINSNSINNKPKYRSSPTNNGLS